MPSGSLALSVSSRAGLARHSSLSTCRTAGDRHVEQRDDERPGAHPDAEAERRVPRLGRGARGRDHAVALAAASRTTARPEEPEPEPSCATATHPSDRSSSVVGVHPAERGDEAERERAADLRHEPARRRRRRAPSGRARVLGRGRDLVGLGHRARLRGDRGRAEGTDVGHRSASDRSGGEHAASRATLRRSRVATPGAPTGASAWPSHRSWVIGCGSSPAARATPCAGVVVGERGGGGVPAAGPGAAAGHGGTSYNDATTARVDGP